MPGFQICFLVGPAMAPPAPPSAIDRIYVSDVCLKPAVLTFIETKLFTSLVGQYLSDDEYAALQQALADNLRSATVKATASCNVMAADAKLSREAVEAVVKSTGVDAVIATSLVAVKGGAKEDGTRDERGGGYYKPVAYGFDYGYFGAYGVPVVYGEFETFPSVLSVSGAIDLATNVYETNGGEKIYGMTTRAKNLESRGMALALITPRIAERLRDDGLVR